MTFMTASQREADPRVQRAKALLAPEEAGMRLGNGHALFFIRHALAISVLAEEETHQDPLAYLEKTVRDWIKPQYQEAILAKLLRIRESAIAVLWGDGDVELDAG